MGIAVDPYISGAAFQEVSPDGKVLQESTASDKNGRFQFQHGLAEGSIVRMKAGMQGKHNNLPFSGILKRKADNGSPLIVSPLTTLHANGMTAEDILTVLNEAGISGLSVQDVFSDPMKGVESDEANLPLIQASLAVNAFLNLKDNYDMPPAQLKAGREELGEMVEAVKTVLNSDVYNWTVEGPQLSAYRPSFGFSYFLRASVAITDNVVAKKKSDPAVDAVEETHSLVDRAPILALFYYVQENRGKKDVEDQIDAGTLPDVSPDEVPVIEPGGEVSENTPPVADAGADQNVMAGDAVALSASRSSDADGDALSYTWTLATRPQGSSASLENAQGVTTGFVADFPGTYEIDLLVNDGKVDSNRSRVTVVAASDAPSQPAPQEPGTPEEPQTPENPTHPDPAVFQAPVLDSVDVNGTSWILNWSQPGGAAPSGGYDIFIDGNDTAATHRTNALTVNLSGLTAGVEHCFQVEGRYLQGDPAQFPLSNEVCVKGGQAPAPTPPDVEQPPYNGGPLPVFPGAVGFGSTTPAGRGGKIIKVTNLNDSGSGSLRAAVEASGARTIVFEVSGRIDLKSNLAIRNPYVTIAGQTAPFPGIMITGRTFIVSTHDVLVQHVSIRVGDENKADDSGRTADGIQITGSGAYNIMFDHVSASWGIDEVVGIGYGIRDITFKNCLIAEGLNRSVHPKGAHGYGFLLGDDSTRIALIGNLVAHAAARLPRIQGGSFLLANNVFYNGAAPEFAAIGSNAGIPTRLSAVGNLFQNGPSGSPSKAIAESSSSTASGSQIYISDNAFPGGKIFSGSHGVSTPPKDAWINGLQYLQSPETNVKSYVSQNVGTRPAERDPVDRRIVNDLANRTGRIIDSQRDVGGFPDFAFNYRPFDVSNPNGDDDGDGYTNLEEVLHGMANQVEGK